MRTKRMRWERKCSRYSQSCTKSMLKHLAERMEHEGNLDPCDRCGGDGMIELHDAPEMWGEDCCSEENRLMTCPDCKGDGVVT